MKSRDEILRWTRQDKRNTKNKHTVVTSMNGQRQYQLMGTLDEEESNHLFQQVGIDLKGKAVLGKGQFGKVRLVRNKEGDFFSVKKIKFINNQSNFNFDVEALQREGKFNDILREKNISGVMRPIDVFTTTDSKGNSVMFQIMPIANLRDGENFIRLQSFLVSDIDNNKLEFPSDLLEQLRLFDEQDYSNSKINHQMIIENEEKDVDLLESSGDEKSDADLLESSGDEKSDADLLESSEDEKGDADLLESSEDEKGDADLIESSEDELSGKSELKLSGLLMKVISLHITQSLAKILHEMHQNSIYHRDIHFKNILFDSRGRVYLSDFGTGIAYDKDRVAVQVTSKLQSNILPPEAKFPQVRQEIIKRGQKSHEVIDEWELGCTLLSFMGSKSSEILQKLQMPIREIQKTHFSGKGSQYQNYMNYLAKELEKFDKEVLSTTGHPAVREVILGLLNPDYNKRMSLIQAANLINGVQPPKDEIILKAFHLLSQYQTKQENRFNSQGRFFDDKKKKNEEELDSLSLKTNQVSLNT
ncbi:3-deoxy-D-manno-octulosonic-acid kinase [Legionella cincinnatiensis]|uniref:non-specific serine/threonine protein kinase n=2 Tax=Legionella cincinnatiensis TaxID=28085 RepID=A0ABR5QWA1_9GAMM|nr:3-deoxy-D-manno-octulosonic-acid kinase [Legionella cincinnatiensis]